MQDHITDSQGATRPINNTVLISPSRGNDEWLGASGVKLAIDTSWEEGRHANTRGMVVAVPPELRYSRKSRQTSLLYKTYMEILVGDVVIYNYMNSIKGEDTGRLLADGNILVRYDEIYCAIRGDKVVMLNGFLLVEADEEPKHRLAVFFRKSETRGVVMRCGSLVGDYLDFPGDGDKDEISVGDSIIFDSSDALVLEYEMHQTLLQGKKIYRMQRRDVLAKLN